MRIRYVLCSRSFASGTAYGIRAVAVSAGRSAALCAFHDLCADEDSVRELIRKCNAGRLSLCHLRDVIDDFLAAL